MSGIICTVCNSKGGIGKTTVTCNLSAGLAIKKKKILVIDNDPQSNSTELLLPHNASVRNSLYELLDPENSTNIPIDEFIYPTIHKGLYVLPNIEQTSALELSFASDFPKSNFYLRNKIRDYAKNNFDYVFIDCSPTLSLFVANALYASDCVIVPIDAGSAYSLDGLRKILELINSIQKSDNPDLKFLKLLINRVDKRTAITQAIISDVLERFGEEKVFKTSIPVNTPFQQAEYAKKTIFSYAPTSRGAKFYRKLSNEFIKLFDDTK